MATGTIKGGITSTVVTYTPNSDSSVKFFFQKSGNMVSMRAEGVFHLSTGKKHQLCKVPQEYMPIQRDSESSQLIRMTGAGVSNDAISCSYVITIQEDGYMYYITSGNWTEVMLNGAWFTDQ